MPRLSISLRCVLHLALACSIATTALADTPFVTGQTLGGILRNDFAGNVGFKFTNSTSVSITISQLGRWVVSGNNQTHALSIYDTSATPVQLATVTVNCSGAPAGQFLYGTLSSPYVLAPNASCYIMSAETIGGDSWYNNFATVLTTAPLGPVQSAYIDTTAHDTGGDLTSYVPVSFQYSSVTVPVWTKSGKTYTTNGTQYAVASAAADASVGDTVLIPAGTFTWGASGSSVDIPKAITVKGAGPSNTTINLDPTGPTFGGAVIKINSAATVRDFSVNGPSGATNSVSAFATAGTNGWRITNITYNGNASQGYFCLVNNVYGLIDNCSITGGDPQTENIFVRGPGDSWQTPSSLGGVNNVFVEDCTFGGVGYVCDANANARMVIRYCTITGGMKIDGHGFASNTPARGVRHMEAYGNTWIGAASFARAFELRGGTGFFFDNTDLSTGTGLDFLVNEYGAISQWPNFGNQYQTPANYPINDQIGVGMDPKAAHSEPMYLWNNKVGAGGLDWIIKSDGVGAGAITLFGSSFTMSDLIMADRDYFKQTVGSVFNGSSGVGRGTAATMAGITPTKTGVGFWVTDEASWKASAPGTSGQFYKWNGSAWVLAYTPYTYPHPLRAPRAPSNLRLAP